MKMSAGYFKELREMPREKLLRMDPLELGLSIRAWNAILTLGAKSISALTEATEVDLLRQKDCGRKTLREIQVVLAFCGLSLRGSDFKIPEHIQSPEEWKAEEDHKRFVARRNTKRRKKERADKKWLEDRVYYQSIALLNLKEYLDRKYLTMDPRDSQALMEYVRTGLKDG